MNSRRGTAFGAISTRTGRSGSSTFGSAQGYGSSCAGRHVTASRTSIVPAIGSRPTRGRSRLKHKPPLLGWGCKTAALVPHLARYFGADSVAAQAHGAAEGGELGDKPLLAHWSKVALDLEPSGKPTIRHQ